MRRPLPPGLSVTLALMLLVYASFARAQTDIGCQLRRFGKFSDWSSPVRLGPVVNSTNSEWWPAIAPNGLSLYFSSNRPGGLGSQDNYVTRRASLDSPWGAPLNGAKEFYVSYRANTEDDLGWEPAVNFGCELAGDEESVGQSFFQDEDEGTTAIYFSSASPGGPGDFDIYKSERRFNRAFGPPVLVPEFGPPVLVPELNTPLKDAALTIRTDGLESILTYNFTTNFGDGDMWVSTRETTSHPWSTPKRLGPTLNTVEDDSTPSLSCDGTTLYFNSRRSLFHNAQEVGRSGASAAVAFRRRARPGRNPARHLTSGGQSRQSCDRGRGPGDLLHRPRHGVHPPQVTMGGRPPGRDPVLWQLARIHRPEPGERPFSASE